MMPRLDRGPVSRSGQAVPRPVRRRLSAVFSSVQRAHPSGCRVGPHIRGDPSKNRAQKKL